MRASTCSGAIGTLLAGLLIQLTAARAADPDKPTPPDDRAFMAQTITRGKALIRLSDLAAQQASSDAIKEFATKTAKDQTKLVEQAREATRDMKIGLDYALEKELLGSQELLTKLHGAEFERAYLKQLLDANEALLPQCEREAKDGTVPEIKAFAVRSLPAFKERLKEVRKTLDGIKDKK